VRVTSMRIVRVALVASLAATVLAFASSAQAIPAPPSGLREALVADGYRYLGAGAKCIRARVRVYCSGHARLRRIRVALLTGRRDAERAWFLVMLGTRAERRAFERSLDPSGRLRLVRADVWRTYLILTVTRR
jgi:hypothetical protein